MTKERQGLDVLKEEISPDNVVAMSETVALLEMKYLIRYIGEPMVQMRNGLYHDIMSKSVSGYTMSDNYDYVQEVAVVLCENMGKRLSDIIGYTKKGKKITVQIHAIHAMNRLINNKFTRMKRYYPLEMIDFEPDLCDANEDSEEQDYTVFDQIVASLNLTENMETALHCRMAGMSFPEIGRILDRATSTVFEYFTKMQQRYRAIYG